MPADWWRQDTSDLARQLGVENAPSPARPEPRPSRPKAMKRPETLAELPAMLTFKEVQARCRIGHTKFYEMLHKKVFVPISVEGKRLVPENQVLNYLWNKIHEANQQQKVS
jgi:hypothetical protein